MVKQYPDILTATIVGPSATDGNGNPIPGADTIRQERCRGEAPNTQATFVKNADGESIPVSYIIYLPFSVAPIPVGTMVSVTRDGQEYCKGRVMRFYNGQLNTRIWL